MSQLAANGDKSKSPSIDRESSQYLIDTFNNEKAPRFKVFKQDLLDHKNLRCKYATTKNWCSITADSSVLTEDTDSFIIGDRVWVGGTRPGHIVFIGETRFAKGDWAGIVLDEPIGKNDGCVGGYRYFQCAPKKGIFSRLTRLTREPLLK